MGRMGRVNPGEVQCQTVDDRLADLPRLEKIKSEVQKLRAWWLEHKSLIERINEQLDPDAGKESDS